MLIFQIAYFAALSCFMGRGLAPRWVWILAVILGLAFATLSISLTIMYTLAFVVIRMLPTNPLFSAVHNQPPGRTDGTWQFLQDITKKLWLLKDNASFYAYGIIYGFVRCCLLLPFALVNPWLLMFLAIGVIYFLAGAAYRSGGQIQPVILAELAVGALFGAII